MWTEVKTRGKKKVNSSGCSRIFVRSSVHVTNMRVQQTTEELILEEGMKRNFDLCLTSGEALAYLSMQLRTCEMKDPGKRRLLWKMQVGI